MKKAILLLALLNTSLLAQTPFTDPRDNKTYKTTKIGSQVWMAENLNYNASGSKCYGNNESNCQKYGRLYNWETAKTACPSGWHLPTNAEWDVLYHIADGTIGTESPYKSETAGKLLKAGIGWNSYQGKSGNGRNAHNFSALPGGLVYPDGTFKNIGNYGYWWSTTADYDDFVYGRLMYYDGDGVGYFNGVKTHLLSIRCVQGPSPTNQLEEGTRSKVGIMSVVNQNIYELKATYNEYLKIKPGFAGKVILKFTIAPSGDVTTINILSSTTDYPEFDNAIKDQVSKWKWQPITDGGNTTPTIPFSFEE